MKIKEVISLLEQWSPLHYQEEYDNSGLQIGDPDAELSGISICLDVSDEILEDAIQSRHNLVISHHPLIFKGLRKINYSDLQDKLLIKAIKNDISIYSMHTNLDNINTGINQKICEMLGLESLEILRQAEGKLYKLVVFCPDVRLSDQSYVPEKVRNAMFQAGAGVIGDYDSCSFNSDGTGTFKPLEKANPYIGKVGITEYQKEVRVETIVPEHLLSQVIFAMTETHPYEEVAYDIYPLKNKYPLAGSGMTGVLKRPLSEEKFLDFVKKTFHLKVIRHGKMTGRQIEKVAVCGGAGSFLMNDAINKSIDAFLTGDLKYHDFTYAENKIFIADIGHYESEQIFTEIIYDFLKEKISTFASLKIKQNFNPINYF